MAAHDCDAVAVRADFHVWNTAKGGAGAITMLDEFAAALS
jgi:hypothetical protein